MYVLDPAAYLANSVVTQHRSFGDNANSQENIGLKVQRVDEVGPVAAYVPVAGSIPNNSVQGLFETDYIDDIDLPEVLFDPAVSDSFATFHVSMWEDEVGAANLTSQTGGLTTTASCTFKCSAITTLTTTGLQKRPTHWTARAGRRSRGGV